MAKNGSATWAATAVAPTRRLPTMASLVTGMPVDKHGITWNFFEFNRGYPGTHDVRLPGLEQRA
ncbi:MAG: hypothetical protein U0361_15465 [Nitrospiraceae bacterium]